ncbi:hypothetical protein ACFX11_034419 [Malus domestica]
MRGSSSGRACCGGEVRGRRGWLRCGERDSSGLDGDQGRASGDLPLGLVGAVAAGRVKGWDPHLSAGVAFDGVGDDWGVDDVFDVVRVVGVVNVVALKVLAPENSGPPWEEELGGGHSDDKEEKATMGERKKGLILWVS